MLPVSRNTVEALLLATLGALLTGIMAAYVIAERGLNRRYEVPLVPFNLPPAEAPVIAEGERLAAVRGCFWCHGNRLEGGQYFASAGRGVIAIAPDLTRLIQQYSPAEFARAVRHGVTPAGTSVQPAMPAFAFYNMSDADLGAIMVYIRSLPAQNGLHGKFRLLPIGWLRWALGRLPPNAADLIDHTAPRPAADGSLRQRGRYLAESVCTECHGDNGRIRVPGTPDLQVTAAYSREQFGQLLRTGAALGERAIDYHMVDAAKYRYVRLTEAEVDALYAWLTGPPAG
jgi:mono/diheme cytochrome c family protein